MVRSVHVNRLLFWTIEATAEQTSTTCEIEEQAGYVYMHIIY